MIENAFGILANRFQVLLGKMRQKLRVVCKVILTCICLHNLMRVHYPRANNHLVDREDRLCNVVPGAWRNNIPWADLQVEGGAPIGRHAKDQRVYLSHYFTSPVGEVEWQNRMIEQM